MPSQNTGSSKAQSYVPAAKIIKGALTKSTQSKWGISNDGFGLLEGSVSFAIAVDSAGEIPVKLDSHPHDDRLKCWKVTTTTRKGGILDVEANYAGIESGQNTDPQIAITVGSATDPIDTHNEFVKSIGGKPSAVLNGAIFVDATTGEKTTNDTNGVFSEFSLMLPKASSSHSSGSSGGGGTTPSTPTEKNIFAGVKSYYSPTITIKGCIYTSTALTAGKVVKAIGKTTYGTVGGLDLLPLWSKVVVLGLMDNSKATGYYQPRNWLVAGASVEEFGAVYKVSYDLTLSGILGWNDKIYSKADA